MAFNTDGRRDHEGRGQIGAAMIDMTKHSGARTGAEAQPVDEGLRSFMLGVYSYMAAGLAVTGIIAMFTASSPFMLNLIFGTPLKWVVMLAPLGFILFASFKIQSISSSTLQTLFWSYAAIMGLSMASIFLVYTGASIAKVFFMTAAMFAGVSLWGYTTKRDLTGMGHFMFMGLIGLLIAMVVNWFLASPALDFAISVIGVLVMVGLTAWETQNLKETYSENMNGESMAKLQVWGAWGLYINFVLMFQFLLSLLGNRE